MGLSQLTTFDGGAGLIGNKEKKRRFARVNVEIISREEQRGLRRSIHQFTVSPLRLLPGIHGDVAMADVGRGGACVHVHYN